MRIENPERTLAAYDMLLEKGLDYPAHKFLEFVSMDVFGNWKWNDFIEGLTRRPGSSRMLQALFLKIVADAISDPFLARDRDKKTTGALAALVKAGRFEDLHHVAVGIAKLREEEMLQVGAIAMHSNWDNKNFARSAIISWVEFQLQKAGRGDLAGIVADAAYDNGVSYIEPASAEKWEPTNEEKAEMGKIIRVIVECANNCKDNTLQIERSIGAHGLKKVKGAAINLIENKENADFSNYSGDDGAGFAPATVRSIALAARKVFLEQGHIPESDEIWDAWNANSPQGRME